MEIMPVFPGGPDALLHFLADSVQYPPLALRDHVQGKVFISFTVNPKGRTVDIQVKQGLRADLDAEALRSANRLGRIRWQPGTQDSRPVSVTYTVPLIFSLNSNSNGLDADSLDLTPGPAIVLPLNEWAINRKLLPPDKGVVYGNCLQRLAGSSSGGFGQYVRLINLDTHRAVRLGVKPAFGTQRSNGFCYALPPGRYALHSYEYTASKWYGGEMHTEALRKAAIAGGSLTATRYVFTVLAGQLHYVGTWDFRQSLPSFSDNKAALDVQLRSAASRLPLTEAVKALPR